ncbi:hypothetical protein IAR55_001187 [Kwoniella newhampshirensis]|uniref:Uncharacterized protein n=1 Tax=Kwoniella newhampshirensis TaxID=1651941 RepID=A0AAW0Z513_9TREE
MADLSQHTNYTAAYSGLLDNFYLTLGIAGACLIGYEIEVHMPRRRGRDGRFQRIPVRVYHAVRGWVGLENELGSREGWEFGYEVWSRPDAACEVSAWMLLDMQEADLLCPAAGVTTGEEMTETDDDVYDVVSVGKTSRYRTLRRSIHQWHKQHRPVPLDALFSTLDSKFQFDPAEVEVETKGFVTPPAPPVKLVVAHPHLPPWEDIPPYKRARGYNDQPAYTDDFDDFLWLPRDPRSTLDLDDTVELRASLTTSAGGTGVIGEWMDEEVAEADPKHTSLSGLFERPEEKPGMVRVVSPMSLETPPRVTFPSTLSRSASGRRPSRLRSGSSLERGRSMSVLSSRSSSAISAQQQALISEVMEEERLAHTDARKEEREERERDEEELAKERRRET